MDSLVINTPLTLCKLCLLFGMCVCALLFTQEARKVHFFMGYSLHVDPCLLWLLTLMCGKVDDRVVNTEDVHEID